MKVLSHSACLLDLQGEVTSQPPAMLSQLPVLLVPNATPSTQWTSTAALLPSSILATDLLDIIFPSTGNAQDSCQDSSVANASAQKSSADMEYVDPAAPSWWLAQIGYTLCIAFLAELGWGVILWLLWQGHSAGETQKHVQALTVGCMLLMLTCS